MIKLETKEEFDNLSEILFERMKNNKSISDNGMLDGMIIGFILTTNFAIDLFLQNEIGRVLDGTMQKLEQIAIWITNNEKELSKIIKEIK